MDSQQHSNLDFEQNKDFLDSFDLERFWYVFKRSRFWLIGFVLLSTTSAYLYVRYTKPVYKSSSVVKLSFESEASTLGLSDVMNTQERNEISGEIELIKSRLFLTRVVEAADLNVSYHIYGRYLTDERYKNSPFILSYKILNPDFFDKPFDLILLEDDSFRLEYLHRDSKVSKRYRYGEEIKTPNFNFLIQKTKFFSEDLLTSKFYFTVNSEKRLVDYLQQSLEVIPENFNAKTIKISLSDYKANKARDLVHLVDSLYLNYTKEVKNQAIEQKIIFLDNQISQTEQKLSGYEDYFEKFTIENRTTDLGQDLNRTIFQLSALDSQRFNLKSRVSDLQLIDEKVKEKGPIVINPFIQELLPSSLLQALTEYSQVQQERELKLGTYNETSYIVQQLDIRLEKSESILDQLISSYLATLEERLEEINRRRESLESNLSQLPSMGTEYSKNRRFYALQEEFMLSLQTSKMELELTRAGTVTKNVILSAASLPSAPIKPQRLLIIAAGFMVGMVFSVVFLLVSYLMHNKVAGIRELERIIKVPLLGGVPDYRKTKLEHTSLVVYKDTNSSISEALRTIRTNMDFLGNGKEAKVISITSTVSGEGKTFVAVNLGGIMAMSGKKVCVVDVDMRKPKVHIAFNESNREEGTSTIIAGKKKVNDAIIESKKIQNLYFIPSGPTPPNPSELLLQKEFDNLIDKLRKEFDTVIIDTPPVGLVTDGRLVMKKSDLQLYIIRADYSRRGFAKVVNDLKASNQYSNIASILNSIDNTPVYGYSYGYGYGYYAEESKVKKIASKLRGFF